MKLRNMMSIVCLTLLTLNSCTEDSGNNLSNQNKGLDGSWFLRSFECCDLPKEEYSKGDIEWTYRNGTLSIQNNISFEDEQYSFQQDGEYDYEKSDTTISITYNNRTRKYDIRFEGESLILSRSPESGGPILTFDR